MFVTTMHRMLQEKKSSLFTASQKGAFSFWEAAHTLLPIYQVLLLIRLHVSNNSGRDHLEALCPADETEVGRASQELDWNLEAF